MAKIQYVPYCPYCHGKGHLKIEPKAKHFSHCKKDQSSRPNQTDNSKRLAKIKQSYIKEFRENSNNIHGYKNIDLIINSKFIGSQQTHRKRRLHRIDLHKRGGEHCIEIQKERRSHLANNYGPEGLR